MTFLAELAYDLCSVCDYTTKRVLYTTLVNWIFVWRQHCLLWTAVSLCLDFIWGKKNQLAIKDRRNRFEHTLRFLSRIGNENRRLFSSIANMCDVTRSTFQCVWILHYQFDLNCSWAINFIRTTKPFNSCLIKSTRAAVQTIV